MRKAGLLAVVVLVAAALGMPAVLGGMTESRVSARVVEINSGDAMSVTVEDYTRGWFSSTARLGVRLSPELLARMGAADVELPAWLTGAALPVVAELSHGPAGINEGPFLGFSKVVARADPDVRWVRELTERYGMPYLFEFRGRTGFTGRVSFDADVPPVDTTAQGGSAQFSGAVLEGTLEGNHLVAQLDVERYSLDSPLAAVQVGGVRATTDSRFLGNSQSTGGGALEIAEMRVASPLGGNDPIEMSGVRFASLAALEDGAWDTRFDYTSDTVRTPGGQRIDSAALGITVDDLDAGAVNEIQALLERASAGSTTGAPAVSPAQMLSALNRIVAGSPSLEIAPLRFTLNGDTLDANVRLDVRGQGAPVDLAQLAGSPLAWANLVDGAVDATIAKPLARRFAADIARAQLAQQAQEGADAGQDAQLAETQGTLMLVVLVGQGYLEESEDAYSTQIRLTDGAFTVNGESVPLFGVP